MAFLQPFPRTATTGDLSADALAKADGRMTTELREHRQTWRRGSLWDSVASLRGGKALVQACAVVAFPGGWRRNVAVRWVLPRAQRECALDQSVIRGELLIECRAGIGHRGPEYPEGERSLFARHAKQWPAKVPCAKRRALDEHDAADAVRRR